MSVFVILGIFVTSSIISLVPCKLHFQVYDRSTGEPLEGAMISTNIDERALLTDSSGHVDFQFTLPLSKGWKRVKWSVSMEGYENAFGAKDFGRLGEEETVWVDLDPL